MLWIKKKLTPIPWHPLVAIGPKFVEHDCHPHFAIHEVEVVVTKEHDLVGKEEMI